MVKHPWPLLEISLSDFRGLATLNINTYLPYFIFYHIAESISNKLSMPAKMKAKKTKWKDT